MRRRSGVSAPAAFQRRAAASELKLAAAWRSGWDSNPRYREVHLISSQARYDHFDTAPYLLNYRLAGQQRAGFASKPPPPKTGGLNCNQAVFKQGRPSPHPAAAIPGRYLRTARCAGWADSFYSLTQFRARVNILWFTFPGNYYIIETVPLLRNVPRGTFLLLSGQLHVPRGT